MVVIKVKLLEADGQIPVYAHSTDSGADLFALEDKFISSNEMAPLRTGIAVELPPGYELQVRSKSGLAAKHNLFVLNSPGTVDQDYRGEIMVLMFNAGKLSYKINKGDKIAQMVVSPVIQAYYEKVEELSDTDRGEGGFGSTGK